MYLHSEIGQNLLQSMVSGATIPLIKLQTLKELPVIIPDEEKANQIISTFDKIVKLQSEIDTLNEEQESLSYAYWNI
jgi:type I restriction enzyme M protein